MELNLNTSRIRRNSKEISLVLYPMTVYSSSFLILIQKKKMVEEGNGIRVRYYISFSLNEQMNVNYLVPFYSFDK